uniref:hypothetical protein n=1 Tax=Labilibaculum sp. TaxID=2060723 RepID=UPI003569FCFA
MVKIEKISFLISFGIVFITLVSKLPFLVFLLLLFALIYLFAGWYLLSMEVKNSQKILPFIVSYLIAQTYIAIVFGIRDYPLKEV